MTPPKWTPALSTIGGWLLAALVAIAILFGLSKLLCHKPPQPVHVSPVPPESVQVIVHDTTPGQVHVVVDRDSLIALEKKVQALTDEKVSFTERETRLKQGIVKIDSVWRARMDSMAGMVAVQYRRGRLDVVQYQRPDYVRVSVPYRSWRNTWLLKAKTDGGLSIEERHLPIDFGVEAALDAWTPPNDLSPSGLASLCLTARTSAVLRWRLGVAWLLGSGPVIVAGAKLGIEF